MDNSDKRLNVCFSVRGDGAAIESRVIEKDRKSWSQRVEVMANADGHRHVQSPIP